MSKEERPIQALVPGRATEHELAPGEAHEHTFELPPGHTTRIVVEQRGIDVMLKLFDPEGSLLSEVDSPSGTEGPETVSEVAEVGGSYGLTVESTDPDAEPGRYEIHLAPPRPGTEIDRTRVRAERAFHEGENLRRAWKFREAIPRYEQALVDWRSCQDPVWEAEALHRLGWMLDEMRNWSEALEQYLSALDLFRETGNRRMEATTLNQIGRARMNLGKPAQAFEDHQRALEIFGELENRQGQAGSLANLGNLHKRAGRIEEAFQAYESALTIWQETGFVGDQATTWLSLGDLYLLQNKLDDALASFERARSLGTQAQDRRVEAISLRRLGDLQDRLGRSSEAREALERSLELRRELEDRRGEAHVLSSLGTVAMKEGSLTEARDHLQHSLELFRSLKDGHGEAVALHKLGRVAYREGKLEQAYERHAEAIPLYRKYRDRQGETSSTFGAARALHDLGRLEDARELLENTTASTQSLRTESGSLELRATYFASRAHYWELYIDTLMELHERDPLVGSNVLAFDAAEEWRARSFLDLLQEARLKIRKGADQDLLEEERRLRERLNLLLANRLLEPGDGSRLADLARSLGGEEQELLRQLDRVHGELRSRSPLAPELTQLTPLLLSEIREEELLDRDTVLLAYFLGPKRSYLWLVGDRLVGDRNFESYPLPDRKTIESTAREVQRHLVEANVLLRDSETEAIDRLSEMILAPLEEALEKGSDAPKRLVVISDGALQYIPFAALRDPTAEQATPLVTNYEIIHLPSASVLAALRERGREDVPDREDVERTSHLIAVIADPVFQAKDDSRIQLPESPEIARAARDLGRDRLAPLPFTRDEATAILELAPEGTALGLLGHDANRDAVMSGRLAPFSVLHFATHGLVSPAHPELSGLVLSLVDDRGQAQAGFLSLSDIYSLEISARLVVLSACDTGLGRQLQGEGLMGLTRGFFHAGAAGLVVSLWQVEDRSTAELMKRFYKELLEKLRLREPLSPAAALRHAQISMIEDEKWNDPYYWAAFTFQGDWVTSALLDDSIEKQLVGAPPPEDYPDDDLPPPRPPSRKKGSY